MNRTIKIALEQVVEYLFDEEKKHYEEMGGDDNEQMDGHIFQSLRILNNYLLKENKSEYEKKVDPEFAMCDGDCGGSYNVEHLHEADMGHIQYKFCKPCMFEFVANQEQEWGEK